MKTLSESIDKVIANIGEKRKAKGEVIYSHWPKIVGNLFAKHSCPADLKEGALIINVENSAWMYMLRLKKQQILKRVNSLSKERIGAIKLRTGKIF